jgi:hypothetical protein
LGKAETVLSELLEKEKNLIYNYLEEDLKVKFIKWSEKTPCSRTRREF